MNRRTFLTQASLGAAALTFSGCQTPSRSIPRRTASANGKLNIGVIGLAHQGAYNLNNVTSENIVALCDVDANYLAEAGTKHPGAKRYADFRQLIDQDDIDAIVVATPDHTHAVCTAAALRSGRHVYCEKPLTHTVSEARKITELARKSGLATQIGTQIHAGNNYRRVVELVQSGAIGPVREVHVWVASSYGGKVRPAPVAVPPHLSYELWLGPVTPEPYSPEYVPIAWRNWWHFGGGSLADFGCHFMDLPFWALDLSHPDSVEAEGPKVDLYCPPTEMTVRYTFPGRKPQARGLELPPVALTWYHGGRQPSQLGKDLQGKWKSGVLFVGSKGQLLSDYSRHQLLPEDQFKDYKRPDPFIPNSIGHHQEWIRACKTGAPTTCHFGYSGPLTEAALLGNVAFRTGRKLEWDAKNLRARNVPDAQQYVQHHYRSGWKL